MKFAVEETIEVKLLKEIRDDLFFLKKKVIIIEEVDAISNDIHEVRPEYIKKLKKIDKEGKFNSFKSIEELRNALKFPIEINKR
jgi:hypothetical protein